MYWEIPKMWEGGECWIIGGGPSMPREFGVPEEIIEGVRSRTMPIKAYSPYLSPIHDKHVIGVNAAFLIGTWIDVVFFGDGDFYRANQSRMDAFPKLKVCCSPHLEKKNFAQGIKFVGMSGKHSHGICTIPGRVAWNLNSGGAAISLAYHFGVKKIYLLGFDMCLDKDGAQHWHRQYSRNREHNQAKRPKKLPFYRHLSGFPMIARDARRLNIEIINVSPDSKITNFERVSLKDVI